MTAEEERISYMLGTKSWRPIVGLSRDKPGVAFVDQGVEVRDNEIRNIPVVIEFRQCAYKFDLATASWKPNYVSGHGEMPDPSMAVWNAEKEAHLRQLRAV